MKIKDSGQQLRWIRRDAAAPCRAGKLSNPGQSDIIDDNVRVIAKPDIPDSDRPGGHMTFIRQR